MDENLWIESKDQDSIVLNREKLIELVTKYGVSFPELGVLMSLLPFIAENSNRLVHPSTKRSINISALADLLMCSRQQLTTHLTKLEAKGIIKRVEYGVGKPNHLEISEDIAFRRKVRI